MSSSKIFCEKINVSKAQYLIDNAEEYGLENKKSHSGESHLVLLKKYVKKAIEGKGIVYQTYFQPTEGHGRRYSRNVGLQGLSRIIRHTISKEYYKDIDICNCHPVILEHYCKSNNIRCSNLSYYIENRERCLSEMISSLSISRDQAKEYYLKPINTEYPNQKLIDEYGSKVPDFFINYSNELTSIIIPKIQELNPELAKEAVKKRPHNVGGSTLNRLICTIENEILETIEEACKERDVEISVLCFDGIMIDKENDTTELIPYIQDKIYNKHNIHLKLVEKEMTEGVEIPEIMLKKQSWELKEEKEKEKQEKKEQKEKEKQEKKNQKEREKKEKEEQKEREKQLKIQEKKAYLDKINDEYLKLKNEFEKTHAKIIESSNFVLKNDKNDIIQMTKTQISDSYQHHRFGEDESFIKKWLNDEDIRVYKRMDSIPNGLECPDDVYNLWTPFQCEEYPPYKCDEKTDDERIESYDDEVNFMIEHIKILCNRDEKLCDYVLKWISQMLRFPQYKTRLLTFIGEEGSGKTSIVDMIIKMIGEKHALITSQPSRDVWGNFNDLMKGETYLVVLNELQKKETLEAEEKIKELITDKTITINPKGRTSYTINSYHRFIALTNREEPINVHKNDRRKVIIRCNDELIGNTLYFNRFRNNLDNKNIIRGIYEWFINYKPDEVEKFHQLKNDEVPITEYQQELAEMNFSYPELFVKYLVYELQLFNAGILGVERDSEGCVMLSVGDIGSHIPDFERKYRVEFKVNAIQLGLRLSRLKIDGIEKIRKTSGNFYRFDKKKIEAYFEKNK